MCTEKHTDEERERRNSVGCSCHRHQSISRHTNHQFSASIANRLGCRWFALWLCSPVAAFSVSMVFHTVGRTPWTGGQPVARPQHTQRTIQTQNKRTQTSMPLVVFEPTIPVFERAKTGSCLRPRGHCDRPHVEYVDKLFSRIYVNSSIILVH
jgi:hypothetical protein